MKQLASNKVIQIVNHELPLARQAERRGVQHDLIHSQKSAAAAVSLACQVSGLDDKEIYMSLNIDAAQFSRIKKGDSNFPADKIAAFCGVVGNTVYPEWIAFQIGCGLVMLKSEAERLADELRAELDEVKKINALMQSLLVGKVM